MDAFGGSWFLVIKHSSSSFYKHSVMHTCIFRIRTKHKEDARNTHAGFYLSYDHTQSERKNIHSFGISASLQKEKSTLFSSLKRILSACNDFCHSKAVVYGTSPGTLYRSHARFSCTEKLSVDAASFAPCLSAAALCMEIRKVCGATPTSACLFLPSFVPDPVVRVRPPPDALP